MSGAGAASRAGEPREQCREIERRLREPCLEPGHDLGHALGGGRLQQVVDGALVERRDRVLVVGGDEHDVAGAGQLARDLEAGAHRHPDVEKRDVGVVHARQHQRFVAVGRLGDDLELGPRLGEARAQLRPQQRLVLGDQRGRHDGESAMPVRAVRRRSSRGVYAQVRAPVSSEFLVRNLDRRARAVRRACLPA